MVSFACYIHSSGQIVKDNIRDGGGGDKSQRGQEQSYCS